MELAVVSHGGTVPHHTDRLAGRLAVEHWAAVYADAAGASTARRLAKTLQASVTVADSIDAATVIDGHPGQQVLVVCDAPTVQSWVASVLDVETANIPCPADSSITRIRARAGPRWSSGGSSSSGTGATRGWPNDTLTSPRT